MNLYIWNDWFSFKIHCLRNETFSVLKHQVVYLKYIYTIPIFSKTWDISKAGGKNIKQDKEKGKLEKISTL